MQTLQMDQKGVITLKVFHNVLFTIDGVIEEECTTIADFDKDYLSYFELRDQLKECGLKDDDNLYYLKPGLCAPSGLALIMDDTQCNQLLLEHEGHDSCSLYIVTNPMHAMRSYMRLLREEGSTNGGIIEDGAIDGGIREDGVTHGGTRKDVASDGAMREDGIIDEGVAEPPNTDNDNDEYSDVDMVPEHEMENRLVDSAGCIFEGDVGDDDLYSLKKQFTRSEQGGSSH